MDGDIGFAEFRRNVNLTMSEICRELFVQNRDSIKILKEETAVRNLARILEAALKLCNRMGFSAMSLRDLSRESGMSMGAMYSYFASKDDLLRLIQAQGRAVVLRVLQSHIDGYDDPRIRLRRAIQAHLYCSEIMQPWFYLSYMETRNFPRDEFQKSLDAELFTEKIIIDIITDGQSKGIFRSLDAYLTGAAIKSLLQDWYIKRWKYSRRKVTVERYCEFLIEFVESYLFFDVET